MRNAHASSLVRALALPAIALAVPATASAQVTGGHIPGAPQVPAISLPAARAAPSLVFAPSDAPNLLLRAQDPAYAAEYQAVRSLAVQYQNAALSSAQGDDTLAAAALHALGEAPPTGQRYASFRDEAVAALQAIGARTPTTLFGGGNLDDLQDSGRLQSMAQAYDLLRGSGVAPAADAAIRARIAGWADAFVQDARLPLFFNNHAIKAGAALVTAALALCDHASAQQWLTIGTGYINDSLADKLTPEGWYGEGPHYVNYSLNNLVSTAYHVRNATGADWFAPLRPLVLAAIAMRQPDGSQAPFEEGIENAFPHEVMIAGYAGDAALQARMSWAWLTSGRDTVNYDNQQLHALTRLVFAERSVAPQSPLTPATRFLGGQSRIAALRGGWDAGAVQATLYAAQDYSDLEIIPDRHNMRDPLDLVVAGAGEKILPTSGGGPTVTSSSSRGYYLDPASRNLPLVNRAAPFLSGGVVAEARDRLASVAAGGVANALVDCASVSVAPYIAAQRATRTVALVGGAYVVVLDDVQGAAQMDVAIPWHGRGARTSLASGTGGASGGGSPPPIHSASWTFGGATLDLSLVSSAPATLAATSGVYAEAWGREEPIQGVEARVRASGARLLSLLEPRASNVPGRYVTALASSGAETLGLAAAYGSTLDVIVAGPRGASNAAGGVETDAALAVVRLEGGAPVGAALVGGTRVSWNGAILLGASGEATIAASAQGDTAVAEVSGDGAPPYSVEVGKALGAPTAGRPHRATFAGQPLGAGQTSEGAASVVVSGIGAGGTLLLEAGTPAAGGSTGGPGTGGSQVGGGSSGGGGGGCAASGGARGGWLSLALPALAAWLLRRALRRA